MVRIKKRIINLDICRTIAILSIISNHSLNSFYQQTDFLYWQNTFIFEKIFIVFCYVFSRLGVTLFLFITGALVLNKNFENDKDITDFYKHNLLSLVISVSIWNIIYYFFVCWINESQIILKDLINSILFFKYSSLLHMWYMPMIIGMYIFLPFVARAIKKIDIKTLILPFSIVILFKFITPNIKILLQMINIDYEYYQTVLDLSFSGYIYGTYILLGYYIWNNKILEKIKSKYLIVLTIIFYFLAMFYQGFAYINNFEYKLYYDNIGIFLCSACLFELIRRIPSLKKEKFTKLFTYFSTSALALYFIHRPLMCFFKKFIINWPQSNILSSIIIYFISIFLSLSIIYLLSKIKFIKKHLLVIKN